MKTLEEFFKNRLYFNCKNVIHYNLGNLEFKDKSLYKYRSKYFTPLDLNIKNSYDLLKRIVPKHYFVISQLKKYLDIDDEYRPFIYHILYNNLKRYRSDDVVKFYAYIYTSSKKKGCWIMNKSILSIEFNLGDLIKDENNLQSIKLQIKERLKKIILILFLTTTFLSK